MNDLQIKGTKGVTEQKPNTFTNSQLNKYKQTNTGLESQTEREEKAKKSLSSVYTNSKCHTGSYVRVKLCVLDI